MCRHKGLRTHSSTDTFLSIFQSTAAGNTDFDDKEVMTEDNLFDTSNDALLSLSSSASLVCHSCELRHRLTVLDFHSLSWTWKGVEWKIKSSFLLVDVQLRPSWDGWMEWKGSNKRRKNANKQEISHLRFSHSEDLKLVWRVSIAMGHVSWFLQCYSSGGQETCPTEWFFLQFSTASRHLSQDDCFLFHFLFSLGYFKASVFPFSRFKCHSTHVSSERK